MLRQLKNLFRRMVRGEETVVASLLFDRHGETLDERVKVATLALLLEVAVSDGELHHLEVQSISESLEQQFGIHPEELKTLFSSMMEAPRGVPAHERVLVRDFDGEQREVIYALLLKVFRADAEESPDEEAVLGRIRVDLGITAEGEARAQRLIEDRLV